ncbi:MAG TPA: Gfo/Idh/MocA family oxidoreductase [Verrucomicrobiae bacterium]|nr:Gfo/Idh/MocA family oxidoreductase [Verrucomicrobiae bacterium]
MQKTFHISRRTFLQKSALAATAAGLPLWFVQRELAAAEAAKKITSPNDRPGIALIGCGGMGQGDAENASRFGDIVAVCDVDQRHADAAALKFTRDGKAPEKYGDFRKALERDDVHAIVQATPDHWHTLINLAAARAKKDVYGEKPLTLTIDEGRHIIKAVRKNKIVFQTGTQQRSSRSFRLACSLVRNGRLGTLKQVDVFVPAGIRGNHFPSVPVPPEFDYDYWLGQAPAAEYFAERCHGTFRWWFDYSGGPVTDWGAHHNDIARWGIGLDGPVGVEARVITPPLPDGFTTPGEFEAKLTWASGVIQTVKTTTADSPYGAILDENGQRNGVKFTGADGWIWVNRDGISASDKHLLTEPLPDNALKLEMSNDHMGNFFECMRSRKDPVAAVETGHRSACIGHLIIIALRTGSKLNWNPEKEIFTGDGAATANIHLARNQRAPYDYKFVS